MIIANVPVVGQFEYIVQPQFKGVLSCRRRRHLKGFDIEISLPIAIGIEMTILWMIVNQINPLSMHLHK